MFVSDQGKDILRAAIGDSGQIFKIVMTLLVVSLIGGTCTVYLLRFGADPNPHSPAIDADHASLAVCWLLCAAALVVIFLFGLPVLDDLLRNVQSSKTIAFSVLVLFVLTIFVGGVLLVIVIPMTVAPMLWRALNYPGRIALFSLLILGMIAVWPSQIGAVLGAPLILAITASTWIVLITTLAAWRRANAFPLLGAIAVGFVALEIISLFGLLSFKDAKRDMIRGDPGFRPGQAFEEAYGIWRQRQPPGTPVIVFVAAAGGGVRASYWTSLILARATDRAPSLRQRLFMASGVSGGSLGLAVYRGLLTEPHDGCGEKVKVSASTSPRESLEPCVSAFHRHDFLAGILGATLTSRIFNSVLPFDLFPPRSHAIEKAWEVAWRKTVNQGKRSTDEFAEPFESLWRNPGPNLVLNTTSSTGGDRIVISNLATEWLNTRIPCKANIAEHLRLPLSAAANASARFPLLEDWGAFAPYNYIQTDQKDADITKQSEAGKLGPCQPYESVADGGFFDNYGASTIHDALNVLSQTLKKRPASEPRPRIIVVQITSDPDCQITKVLDPDVELGASCEEQAAKRLQDLERPSLWRSFQVQMSQSAKGREFWFGRAAWPKSEKSWLEQKLLFSDPRVSPDPGVLGVLMNARTITGLNVAHNLRCRVINEGGSYYHFSMSGAFDSPLGWSLSTVARNQLEEMLPAKSGNGQDGSPTRAVNTKNLASLINEINGEPPAVLMRKC